MDRIKLYEAATGTEAMNEIKAACSNMRNCIRKYAKGKDNAKDKNDMLDAMKTIEADLKSIIKANAVGGAKQERGRKMNESAPAANPVKMYSDEDLLAAFADARNDGNWKLSTVLKDEICRRKNRRGSHLGDFSLEYYPWSDSTYWDSIPTAQDIANYIISYHSTIGDMGVDLFTYSEDGVTWFSWDTDGEYMTEDGCYCCAIDSGNNTVDIYGDVINFQEDPAAAFNAIESEIFCGK